MRGRLHSIKRARFSLEEVVGLVEQVSGLAGSPNLLLREEQGRHAVPVVRRAVWLRGVICGRWVWRRTCG